jgi:hypothetical protein
MKNVKIENMEQNQLNDAEKQKKIKNNKMINGFLIGVFVGIAVYSAVKNGFGFFTFFPLILAYLLFYNKEKIKLL